MSTDDTWEDVSIGRMFAYAHRHHRAFVSTTTNNMSELMVERLLDYLLAIPAARRQFVRACWSLLGLPAPTGTPTYTTEQVQVGGRTDLTLESGPTRVVVELKVAAPVTARQLLLYDSDATLAIVATRDLENSKQDLQACVRGGPKPIEVTSWNELGAEILREVFAHRFAPFWTEVVNCAESVAVVAQPLTATVADVTNGVSALAAQSELVDLICAALRKTMKTGDAAAYFWYQSGQTGSAGFGVSWAHDEANPEPVVGVIQSRLVVPLGSIVTLQSPFGDLVDAWLAESQGLCNTHHAFPSVKDLLSGDKAPWDRAVAVLSGCSDEACSAEAAWYEALLADIGPALSSLPKGLAAVEAALRSANADALREASQATQAALTFEVLGRALQDARAYLHAQHHQTTGLRDGFGFTASTPLTVRADLRTGRVLVDGEPVVLPTSLEATAHLYVDAVLGAVKRHLIRVDQPADPP